MEHYGRVDWLLYLEDKLDPARRAAMELHLESCELCLNKYLTEIYPDDIDAAGVLFSAGFNERLRRSLFVPVNAWRLLQYYTVAAIITVFLMASGWFDLWVQELPKNKTLNEAVFSSMEKKVPYGWSEHLLNFASERIDKLTRARRGKS